MGRNAAEGGARAEEREAKERERAFSSSRGCASFCAAGRVWSQRVQLSSDPALLADECGSARGGAREVSCQARLRTGAKHVRSSSSSSSFSSSSSNRPSKSDYPNPTQQPGSSRDRSPRRRKADAREHPPPRAYHSPPSSSTWARPVHFSRSALVDGPAILPGQSEGVHRLLDGAADVCSPALPLLLLLLLVVVLRPLLRVLLMPPLLLALLISDPVLSGALVLLYQFCRRAYRQLPTRKT